MGGHATIHGASDTETRIGGGIKWVPINVTDGAAHVAVKSSDVSDPSQWYVNDTVTSTGAGTLYESGDVSMYNYFLLELSGTGAETTTVSVTLDGVNYAAVTLFDLATQAAASDGTGLTTDGIYYLHAKVRGIKLVDAGGGTQTARFSHGNI